MTGQNKTSGFHWQVPVAWLILIALLVWVEYGVSWERVLGVWGNINPMEIGVALLLMVLATGLAAWRLYDYFPQYLSGVWLATWRLFLTYNLVDKFRLTRRGDIAFPELMRSQLGIDYAHSRSALLWFRFLDLHALLTFALYPLFIVTPLKRIALPLLIIWMLIPMVIYLLHNRIYVWFAGKDGTLSQLAQDTVYGIPDSWGSFFRGWLMTWAIWLVQLITLAWLFSSLLPTLSWNMALLGSVTGELVSFLPVFMPMNVGIYELGVAFGLLPVASLMIGIIAGINLHLFKLVSGALGGLIALFLPRKPLTQPTIPVKTTE